jgi:oligoendopeptidase F
MPRLTISSRHDGSPQPFPGAVALPWADAPERAAIPVEYTWNLADLYPSDDAWREARERIAADVPRLRAFAGRLGLSAATLAEALTLLFGLHKEVARAAAYAGMRADEDTRDATHEGMRQQIVQLAAALGAEAAYVEPEILQLPPGTLVACLAAEPALEPYRFYLEDIARRAPHTLSPAEERLLADVVPLAEAPSSVYNILTNADFPYPTVTLADGRAVRVTHAGYTAHRASANRQDRQAVMSAYFTALGGFGRTFGTLMHGNLQKALFLARARRYASSLEATLDGPNIPVTVYRRLVEGVNRNLPTFHRYLRLRQRMLGVDVLRYHDLYAPLVASVSPSYTPEQAREHIMAAMAPLGDDYVAVLRRAFGERWIDLFPTPGKRSGAYSEGSAYDVHPYMLINYNGKYDDMSTLAHELGHTMQSYYSNRTQPYPTADYPLFVAEVASTFNESLLVHHMLETVTDPAARLSLLGSYLEGIRGTVFRQTQFAEFELRMHELAAEGRPVTGESLAALYLDLTKHYYGHDQGVVRVDDYVAHEWSFIPHFYREFYVFQYATSFTASEALAQKVRAGSAEAVARYLRFLAAGGSQYPIDLLKAAGVDMTTDEPLALTVAEMNRVIDEMETLIAAGAGGQ